MKLKIAVASVLLIALVVVGSVMVANLFANQQTANPSASTVNPTPSSSANSVTPSPTSRSATYTATEVAKHSTASDCWLIIHNEVYDVTKFIPQHPGGADRIIEQCGKDATVAFDTQGGEGRHDQMAVNLRESFKIGMLASE